MKKLLLGLVLLGGCGQVAATPEPPSQGDQEMLGMLAMAYDPAQLRTGQWVLYSVRKEGSTVSSTTKLQVVAEEPGGYVWIELKLPIQPVPVVVKSRVDRAGKLHEQWVGESGSRGPAQTYPRTGPDGRPIEAPVVAESGAKTDMKVTDEIVTVGGKQHLCKKVTTTVTYGGGRTSSMINWCHPDVPFSFKTGNDSLGGVVKRVYGAYTMELAGSGQTGARSELEIPRR